LPNDEHIRHLLEANADDEQTHFIGFQNLAIAYKTPKELVQEAEVFTKSIIDNPEHTLVKSGVLELGVFFVSLPLMRKIGPIGAQLLSGNVSRDEARHVKTNFEVMDEMGYNIPISLDKARKEAVAWLTSNLTLPGLGPDYWMRQSDKLISTRKAPDLKWTKRGQVSATFEISNRNMGDYATNHQ
jgi:rubrerythrin